MSWSFWIDRGGTFTDFVAVSPDGKTHLKKMLSTRQDGSEVVAAGIKEIAGNDTKISEVRVGTTLATNALLERQGASVALVTTLGFRDTLTIRYQNRRDIYQLQDNRVSPLYQLVTEVLERVDAKGNIITALDTDIASFELERLLRLGIESLAISLVNAYRNPTHELALAELANNLGFKNISVSHQLSPRIRYIARTETTTIDAYLTPKLNNYSQQLADSVTSDSLLFMQSYGGLCPRQQFRGHSALLSGPAGGVVGASKICQHHAIDRAITFDMGGTSTDIALYDGEYQMRHEGDLKGFLLQTPRIAIHTIASGGGSILQVDDGRQTVGPQSAGAIPGPICYRHGGDKLTITDANLLLGRIQQQFFPKIFGEQQDLPLDRHATQEKFQHLADQQRCNPYQLAQGFIDIAVEKMALAVRQVCIENGYDAQQFTLFCFGGAGAQLICQIADRLAIKKIIVHPLASVLSALGIGLAEDTVRQTVRVHRQLNDLQQTDLDTIYQQLIADSKTDDRQHSFTIEMRCRASDHLIDVKETQHNSLTKAFNKKYRALFGIKPRGQLIVENITLEARLPRPYRSFPQQTGATETIVPLYNGTDLSEVPLYKGAPAGIVTGPAIIADQFTTVVIDDRWVGQFSAELGWQLTRHQPTTRQMSNIASTALEVFYQRVHAIAEEMGFVLKHAGQSVVIKERLDYSCAIFLANGELLTSAPHIPVHLGSMSECVKYLVANIPAEQLKNGDSYVTNHPVQGGTHLPDITVITPIFYQGQLQFFVASRGHHTDIGGIAPGSMPANSQGLAEDGVIIPLQKIVDNFVFLEDTISNLLQTDQYPVRNLKQNLNDLQAQLAANERGKQGLNKLITELGLTTVVKLAEGLLAYTTEKIRRVLQRLPDRQVYYPMDNDRYLQVQFRQDSLLIDFTGCCPADRGNFNAPPAIVKSACLFVLRCMLDSDVPLNDGLGRLLKIVLPAKSLVNPPIDAAVVAGNVETSQAICDVLFEAFAVCAHAQGTMNNFSFGDSQYQYYETIAGGSGAGATHHGVDATQVHMTNSRITDPEILELICPVLVRNNVIRRGSGGIGKHRGGDGVYRRIEFLADLEANILSQRRTTRPQGLAGGGSALAGRNIWQRTGQQMKMLTGVASVKVKAGDQLAIETPGGGGYGTPSTVKGTRYFAYGSNLDPLQMQQRCPDAVFVERARLPNHRLLFCGYSKIKESAVANIKADNNSTVWGAVYLLTDNDWQTLDRIEGNLYRRQSIEVITDDDRKITVDTYVMHSSYPEERPATHYWWQVYKGLSLLNIEAGDLSIERAQQHQQNCQPCRVQVT